jgi:hypothetical protein
MAEKDRPSILVCFVRFLKTRACDFVQRAIFFQPVVRHPPPSISFPQQK